MLPGRLTIFFPAYNDEASIPVLVEAAFTVGSECAPDLEVLVINDGSRDRTADVLEALQKQWGRRLRVVTHETNRGYGAALRSGFEHATGEFVFYTDGDGQYDLRDLPALVRRMPESAGWVNGYKDGRGDPWYRILMGRAYCEFVRAVFRLRLRDIDCDFRLFRRDLIQSCRLTSTSGTICVEMVLLLERSGVTAVEAPVRHLPRRHGRSQFFRIAPLFRTLVQLGQLHRRYFFS